MRILCLDFDDVIFDTKSIIEDIIDKIQPEATGKHLRWILDNFSEVKHKEKKDKLRAEHFDYKDRVLEEVDPKYKNLIDYDAIFETNQVFESTMGYMNYLIEKAGYDKIYILSHCNVDREVMAKQKFIKKYFPNVEFIPVPYHKEKYDPSLIRKPTSKAEYFMEYTGITDLSTCTLIDDSGSNCEDWKKHGGIAIKYNSNGKVDFDKCEINSLNPFAIEIIESQQLYDINEGVRRK